MRKGFTISPTILAGWSLGLIVDIYDPVCPGRLLPQADQMLVSILKDRVEHMLPR